MKKNLSKIAMLIGVMSLMLYSCEDAIRPDVVPSNGDLQRSNARISTSLATYALSSWMGSVDGAKKLSELSIPGTHDSGARFESVGGTAKCQNLTINDQLTAGTRYLDVRCRHYYNAFTIHHGSVYQNLNFDDVKNACIAFLQSNPTETIIMSVKEEYNAEGNTRSFEATFDSYVQQNPTLWYFSESVPALNTVRGKIVLLRRFNVVNLPKGIDATNWADNTTFEINNAQASLKIQDQYKVPDNNGKWNVINSLLTETKSGSASKLYINYFSGYKSLIFGIPSITTVSNNINPRLNTYFSSNTTGRFGIIAMDFAESGRNDLIVKTNW